MRVRGTGVVGGVVEGDGLGHCGPQRWTRIPLSFMHGSLPTRPHPRQHGHVGGPPDPTSLGMQAPPARASVSSGGGGGGLATVDTALRPGMPHTVPFV